VFDLLADRCGLAPGTPTLEIGPGAGQATVDLLAHGASPLVAIEPDPSLAEHLRARFGDRVDVRNEAFETAELAPGHFALAASATAWHWVDQPIGFARLVAAIRPGGWWAMWWTTYHDPERLDALYHALQPILEPVTGGPAGSFCLDREARLADLRATRAFDEPTIDEWRWRYPLDADRARRLFGTFSGILALPDDERASVLERIGEAIDKQFGGYVERNVVTIVYTARRT